MVTLGGDAILVEGHYMRRAFGYAQLTPLTIYFTDNDASLEGHSFLL
jgi:hypothetical protein